VFLYAREKWGKSSLFAHAPNAVYFMTRGETGLVELIASNRVPATAHFPYDEQQPPTWATLRQAVKELREEEHPYRFLVIDTCNGAETLCQDYVRRTKFDNSQKKFAAYGKGWDECRIEWHSIIQDLDALRARRKMTVVLLAHTQVKKFDDPTAEESYDKYRPACQEKLWEITHKWADIICFGHFQAQVYESDSGKIKARNEVRRVLCFDQSPLWETGNRYGLNGQIDMSGGAKVAFNAFAKAVAAAKHAGLKEAAAAAPTPAAPVQTSAPAPAAPPAAPPPAAEPDAYDPDEPDTGDYDDGEPEPPEGDVSPDAEPRPMPAAERRTEPPASDAPKVGGDMVKRLIELMHQLEVNWAQIRDSDLQSKGAAIAEACGLKCDPDMKINQLTAAESLKLKAELEARVAEKKQRAEKRAAKKGGAE
jgi:hypothetical protein